MNARILIATAACAAMVASASTASAFCRTTSCDPNDPGPNCKVVDGCLVGGLDLFWKGRCVTFTVEQGGSPSQGISYDAARQTISNAFQAWMFADCGGDRPALDVIDLGEAKCDRVEFNKKAPNANIWMFRDDDWPYADNGHTLALTTITFNVETGEILDADVELNSAQNVITLGDQSVQADLASIATHEAGHFLGLSHSPAAAATMFAQYKEGDVSLRALDPDDVAGICDVFDPAVTEDACLDEPRHGFSRECATKDDGGGCAAHGEGGASSNPLIWVGLGVFTGLARRRRRRAGWRAPHEVEIRAA